MNEATAVKAEDLRKVFPRALFKLWKIDVYKPAKIHATRPGYEFSVTASEGYPDILLKWPKSLGESFIPSGRSWAPKLQGTSYVLLAWSDADSWDSDVTLLKSLLSKQFNTTKSEGSTQSSCRAKQLIERALDGEDVIRIINEAS
jgi:hypothetical protein